jgi:hypothetical protein
VAVGGAWSAFRHRRGADGAYRRQARRAERAVDAPRIPDGDETASLTVD